MTDEATTAPLAIDNLDTGSPVSGKVTYLAPYGAMVDIGLGRDALLHISQLGRSDFRNIEDVLAVGDDIEAYVLKVDDEQRVALTVEKPPSLPWSRLKRGEVYTGKVTRIEDYGAFVDIGAERPGMVHVSELADNYVQSPSDVVKVGDEVEVRVIKLNRKSRQIDLSMKASVDVAENTAVQDEDVPSAMELAFRRAQEQAQNEHKEGKKSKGPSQEQEDILSRTLRNHSS